MPLWPWQKRSGATSAEPSVPNRRTVLPSVRRADKPRHFSVNSITPSGVKAMSQGFCKPLMTTVRFSRGVSGDGVAASVGDEASARRTLAPKRAPERVKVGNRGMGFPFISSQGRCAASSSGACAAPRMLSQTIP